MWRKVSSKLNRMKEKRARIRNSVLTFYVALVQGQICLCQYNTVVTANLATVQQNKENISKAPINRQNPDANLVPAT